VISLSIFAPQVRLMKNILIDIYKIKDLYSGLGQFSLNFANEIASRTNTGFRADFLIPDKISEKNVAKGPEIGFVHADFQKRYMPCLNKKYDIWHSLYQFPSHKPGQHGAWILTIHDLNFLLEKSADKAGSYLKKLQKNIDKADCVTTISNYTKDQIESNIDLKGKQVRVIYNGIPPNKSGHVRRPDFIDERKFFFSIGIFNRKKNFHTLIPVMQQFPDHVLVIAGNNETAYGEEISAEVKKLGLENSVILAGKVSEEEKYWLYNNCEAFLFPSLAEGFGMPVIEAMKAGRPVFLSRYTSLPEIGGDTAFYFENFEDSSMAATIQKGIAEFKTDSDKYKRMLEENSNQFTWENCIRQYLQLYREYF